MNFFKKLIAVSVLGVAVIASVDRAGATDYKHVVLADDPAVYYEFNEPVGAIQVIDTTGKLNTDGSDRNSQFVGQRTRQKSDTTGYELNPGTNVIFGGLGPLGTMVEFNDPTPAGGSDNENGHGGYIETGLHKRFGPTATDYTIEFLYRDDQILTRLNRWEQLVSQARPDHPGTAAGLPEGEQRYIVGTGVIDNDPYTCDISPDFCDYSGGADISLGQNRTAEGASYAPGEIISHYGEGGYNAANVPRAGNRNDSGVVPTQGKWIHIVQTFEQGGSLPTSQGGSGATAGNGRGVIRWYFDGVAAGVSEILGSTALVSDTLDFADKGFNDSDAPLILGATGPFFFAGSYFDGFMDEFAVYDTRLDDPNGDGDMSDSRIPAHADAFAAAKASFGSADFDYDSDVDGDDFLTWQRSFGPGSPVLVGQPGGGINFGPSAAGDANADNLSDGVDLGIWENQFGTTTALATSTSVPEPSTGLLLGGLLALAAMGRRRVGASC